MRLLLAALLLTSACGYQVGTVASGRGRTVSVPMFDNLTFRRELEKDVTRAVRQEIRSRTEYLLTDSAGADLVIEGRVVEVTEGLLSERTRGEIRESSVRIVVEVTVRDTRSGEPLVENRQILERRSFVPVKGESLRSAESAAIRALAERVVMTLASEW